ncbi:Smr/MutS family protein [Basilea psittacipulmonis]|uniref:Smr/MutS family protein n=1 Tax=Basilea psittacipulmonis TaxID=1472345 RepID=UPI00068C05D1|nr:Smr/MutS family protein [Basilea psittacipulmonis]
MNKIKSHQLSDLKKLQKAFTQQQKIVAEKASKTTPSHPQQARLKQEDINLFRANMKGVKAIKNPNRYEHHADEVIEKNELFYQIKRQHAQGDAFEPQARLKKHTHQEYSDQDSYVKNKDHIDLLKKLKTGTWPVTATLDLHGNTTQEAWQRLNDFLKNAIHYKVPCINIIHGQGHGSKENAVLKPHVRSWLKQIDAVNAYCTAPNHMGGDGAVLVLLDIRSHSQ